MNILQTSLPEFDPSIAEEFGYQIAQGPSYLGIPLADGQSILALLLRFAFNLLVSFVITWFFYYRKGGRRGYFFTFMVFSSAMFLLLFLMENVKLQIGFTLGLFAIFGMIRYRTESVPIREMTYLFVIIALSVINGIALSISYAELFIANILIVILIMVCEVSRKDSLKATKVILYDKIDLIVPSRRSELIEDLNRRTGLEISKVEVGHVDFLRDAAYVKIFYSPIEGEDNTIGNIVKPKEYV